MARARCQKLAMRVSATHKPRLCMYVCVVCMLCSAVTVARLMMALRVWLEPLS